MVVDGYRMWGYSEWINNISVFLYRKNSVNFLIGRVRFLFWIKFFKEKSRELSWYLGGVSRVGFLFII